MEPFDLGLFKVGVFDVIDIVLVAFIIYQIYNLIRGTIAVNIFIGLMLIYLLWIGVKALNMQLLSGILDKVIGVGVIALIIVFQQEIRRFLLLIGRNTVSRKNSFWRKVLLGNTIINDTDQLNLYPIVEACRNMSQAKIGALIVFARTYEEQVYSNNGELMNARISKRLLESIFSKTSPLHDGAVVISDGIIKAASCILPLTDNTELPEQLGLRHRAAVGITEQSDSIAVIISEETGYISIASRGKVKTNVSVEELERTIRKSIN
jgi:diadenylate cyclase